MLQRRCLLGFFIFSTICLSLWIISLPPLIESEFDYSSSQYQSFSKQNYILNESYNESSISHNLDRILPTSSSLSSSTITTTTTTTTTSSSSSSSSSSSLNVSRFLDVLYGRLSLSNFNTLTLSPKFTTLNVATATTSSANHLWNATLIADSIDYNNLSKDDFVTLVDLNNFEFLINQPACVSVSSLLTLPKTRIATAPVILMLVHSAPNNFEKRSLIRNTWGSIKSLKFRLIFLLGDFSSAELQQNIKNENEKYADIVQGNFVDTYKNMTYKHMMALKWYTYYCPHAQYLVKVDDDVYVNTIELIDFLEDKQNLIVINDKEQSHRHHSDTNNIIINNHKSNKLINKKIINTSILENNQLMDIRPKRNNFLFCQKHPITYVKRTFRSKWRASTKEYKGRYYPSYCPGYSIVYSPDVAYRLYVEGQKTPYFWIDDVHVTGTLAQQANITITSFKSFLLPYNICKDILNGKTDIRTYTFFFTVPELDLNEIQQLWNINMNAYQRNDSSIISSNSDKEYFTR